MGRRERPLLGYELYNQQQAQRRAQRPTGDEPERPARTSSWPTLPANRPRRARAVRIRSSADDPEAPEGLVLDWARSPEGRWLALVIYVVDVTGGAGYTVQRWMPADALEPIRPP